MPNDGSALKVEHREATLDGPAERPSDHPARQPDLAALPPDEYEALVPGLERVSLELKQNLIEPHEPIRHVYFPLEGLISLVTTMSDGITVEVGPVGREGMAGLPVFLGATTTPIRALAQIPGEAVRMSAAAFRQAAEHSAELRRVMQLYAECTITTMAIWVACNRIHPIEERFARWMLMCHDRVTADDFSLTHEFMAQMMGVRRASVTVAAGIIQKAGLIRYTRGRVTILDREGLEAASCECYRMGTEEWDRLLGSDYLKRRGA